MQIEVTMATIELIDSLTNAKPSYDRIAFLQQQIKNTPDMEIDLLVHIERRLGLTPLFCISTLPLLSKCFGKQIHIFCNRKSQNLFCSGGYIPAKYRNTEDMDIAPLLEENAFIVRNVNDVISLVKEITIDAPVKMSDELAALFTSKVGEMFNNSLEHSEGQFVMGGKYFKNQKNKYCFACYDTGVGIPQKVIQNIPHKFTEVEALRWAIKRGNSTAAFTKKELVPRGLGLDMLQSFANANDGTIRICSGKVLYKYSRQERSQFFELNNRFEGTLFEMDIIADNEHRYILK